MSILEASNLTKNNGLSESATPENFMKFLPDGIQIRELSLLGSHDAGTYYLDTSAVSPDESSSLQNLGKIPVVGWVARNLIIKTWAQSQSLNISQQLSSGVRYFDFRVVIDLKGQFCICHGLYGPNIDEIIQQLDVFLKKFPNEVVMIDFPHLFDRDGQVMTLDQQTQLVSKFKAVLGDRMASSRYGVNVTLGQLHKDGKQIIVFFDNLQLAETDELLWNRNTFLNSPWFNKTDWAALQQQLDLALDNQPQNQFFVDQAILTPDANMIILGIFTFQSLMSVEKRLNANVLNWYAGKMKEKKASNILMIDNVGSIAAQLFPLSWDYNNHLRAG